MMRKKTTPFSVPAMSLSLRRGTRTERNEILWGSPLFSACANNVLQGFPNDPQGSLRLTSNGGAFAFGASQDVERSFRGYHIVGVTGFHLATSPKGGKYDAYTSLSKQGSKRALSHYRHLSTRN